MIEQASEPGAREEWDVDVRPTGRPGEVSGTVAVRYEVRTSDSEVVQPPNPAADG